MLGSQATSARRQIAPRLDAVTGQFDITTVEGRKQHAVLSSMAKATADSVKTVFDQVYMRSQNVELAGRAATQAFQDQRRAAERSLRPFTQSAEQAKAIVDAYYALPPEVAIAVSAPDADSVLGKLDEMKMRMVTMPDGSVVIVSNTEAEALKAKNLGATVDRLPDGRFRIEWENQAQVNEWLTDLVRPRTVPVTTTLSIAGSFGEWGQAEDREMKRRIRAANAFTAIPRNIPQRWGGWRAARAGLSEAGIAHNGRMYSWAEPGTGGEAFIPRLGQRNRSMAILSQAASWYGAKVQTGSGWSGQNLRSAAPTQIQITVSGEGVISGMIDARVDGRLVKVAQTVARGRVR